MKTIGCTTIAIFFVLLLMAIASARVQAKALDAYGSIGDARASRQNDLLLCIFTMILVFVSTFRHGFIDTRDYILQYHGAGENFSYLLSNSRLEKGWLHFLHLLNQVSHDPRLLLFVCALVINCAYVRQMRRYATDLAFTLFLYFTQIYLGTNNGMRQYFAAAILFLAFEWIINNNYVKFILLVLLLSLVHTSVLVCIPVFFIARGRRFNAGIIGVLGLAVVTVALPGPVFRVMVLVLGDSSYCDFLLKTSSTMGGIRLLVEIVPCILAVMYCHYLRKNGETMDKTMLILTNVTFINFAVMVMSLRMVYFARIGMYFNAFIIMAMPMMIQAMFHDKERRIVKTMAILLFAAYFFYQLKAYGAYLTPFYLDFS